MEQRPARQGCKLSLRPLTKLAALSISTKTRTCPHCAEPMFLVNLEREGHDHLRAHKCSSCKKTSQFVPLSDAPTLWLAPETQSRDLDKIKPPSLVWRCQHCQRRTAPRGGFRIWQARFPPSRAVVDRPRGLGPKWLSRSLRNWWPDAHPTGSVTRSLPCTFIVYPSAISRTLCSMGMTAGGSNTADVLPTVSTGTQTLRG
jgi:hypothetical protein